MHAPKAVEVLMHHVKEHDFDPDKETNDAILLGIQALRRVQNARICGDTKWTSLLPGETEATHD